ncbi:putative transcriptional regulator of viral defense system [Rhodococcus sp. 27YEA15]|uniref:type IV toxin-antitoxin system AbiEi family antitoxin domain-containing protein n=1 Tax=Rhodococcus sp. 27YEA15 TaxID=3156259 RepID=UPI003C7C491F
MTSDTGSTDTGVLESLAACQCGFVTVRQAEALGFGQSMLVELTESGSWTCDRRGLFRWARVRRTELDDFAKWCTWFGGTATVSHYSAADLHGLGHLGPRFVHLSVATAVPSPARQVALHRSPLGQGEFEQIGPIRITTPLRTVHDLAAGGISQELLNEVVADGVAIGRLDTHEIRASCASACHEVAVRVESALAAAG